MKKYTIAELHRLDALSFLGVKSYLGYVRFIKRQIELETLEVEIRKRKNNSPIYYITKEAFNNFLKSYLIK